MNKSDTLKTQLPQITAMPIEHQLVVKGGCGKNHGYTGPKGNDKRKRPTGG